MKKAILALIIFWAVASIIVYQYVALVDARHTEPVPAAEPETVYVEVPGPTQIIYREQPAVKVLHKVVEEVPGPTIYVEVPDHENRLWESKKQLLRWLSKNWVESMGDFMCIPEALELQRRANRDGFQMSLQGLFYGKKAPEGELFHVVASATLVNYDTIFIEPVKQYIYEGYQKARR